VRNLLSFAAATIFAHWAFCTLDCRRSYLEATPSVAVFGGRVAIIKAHARQKQVPHRAFSPIRNDIPYLLLRVSMTLACANLDFCTGGL